MSGYYPEGVTGREYEIAGAEREWTEERIAWCDSESCADYEVEKDILIDLQSYGSDEWGTWNCETCGHENDYSGEARDY